MIASGYIYEINQRDEQTRAASQAAAAEFAAAHPYVPPAPYVLPMPQQTPAPRPWNATCSQMGAYMNCSGN
jgi:hypothetical protein